MNDLHADTGTDIDLSVYDDDYARAGVPRAEAAPPDEIPDGVYDAVIEDILLSRTATTGNPMVLWRLRIHGPQCEGKAVTKVRVITAKTLAFLKQDLERLDMHLDRLSDLPGRAPEMVDLKVRILKKTNSGRRWTDVYFLGLLSGEPTDGANGAWPAGTDDDLPF